MTKPTRRSPIPQVRMLTVLSVVLLLSVLAGTLAGCSLPSCQSEAGGPAVRVSQQAAQRLQARVEQILGTPRPDFVLEATDEEVTSYLTLNLTQTQFTDAEVRFLDGNLLLSARVAQLLNLDVATTWTAQVTDGQLRVKLVKASVACLPLPTQLLDSLTGTINQMIQESQLNIQVKEIRLETGRVVVIGARTR